MAKRSSKRLVREMPVKAAARFEFELDGDGAAKTRVQLPGVGSALLRQLTAKATVAVPLATKVVSDGAKSRVNLDRVVSQANSAEEARLARHRRLAKLEKPSVKKPSVVASKSEFEALAAKTWAEVTGGSGVVLADGEPLEIPSFLGGGAKP